MTAAGSDWAGIRELATADLEIDGDRVEDVYEVFMYWLTSTERISQISFNKTKY